MEYSQDDLVLQIRQLQRELADIRRRVLELEAIGNREPAAELVPVADISTAPSGASAAHLNPAASVAPLFGWAFLGLSGAYLLRAATETGTLPVIAGVSAGILYAAWWIFLAARRAWEDPIASTVHSVTSVLILAPLLWEATLRFHAVSTPLASVVLVAFTIFGLGIGWHHKITAIAFVATLTGLVTSAALFRESHNAPAWIASVLVIAAAVEFSACRDHWLGLRWAAALTADLTVLTITMIALDRSDSGSGAALVPAALALVAQVALLGIYLTSTAHRTLIRRLGITGFEIGQAVAAFLVGIGGALYLRDLTQLGSLPVGLVCLGCSLTCYVISYAVIGREAGQNRNFYAYSTFAVALLIVAGTVLFSSFAPLMWACVAVVMTSAGLVTGRMTLRVHAGILLILATLVSNALPYATSWLIQPVRPAATAVSLVYFAVFAGALLCYGIVVRFGLNQGAQANSTEAVLPAAIWLWLGAGIAAMFLSRSAASAPLRTALLTVVALSAARTRVVTPRRELAWISYAFVAAAGLKLIFEDFRLGGSLGVFVSLMLFGATLILLPRMFRAPAPHRAAMRAGA